MRAKSGCKGDKMISPSCGHSFGASLRSGLRQGRPVTVQQTLALTGILDRLRVRGFRHLRVLRPAQSIFVHARLAFVPTTLAIDLAPCPRITCAFFALAVDGARTARRPD